MKKYRYRLILYACILCGLISLLTFSCFNSWKQIYNNRKLRAELETKYEKLVDNEDVLEGEVFKIPNMLPNMLVKDFYIPKMAR